jgi:RNA polymerase sigma factor for flagellar operon FliA
VSDTDALWDRYTRSPDKPARDALILRYRPLVEYVAGRLAVGLPSNIEQCDLEAYGVFGLVDAIERFDRSRGYTFETYAMARIRGAILDELRKIDVAPRSVRARARAHEQVIARLESQLRRQPTVDEVAAELGVTVKQYLANATEISGMKHVSLDTTVLSARSGAPVGMSDTAGERVHLSETLPSLAAMPVAAYEIEEIRQAIADGITKLPHRLSVILHLYYAERLTHAEIGVILGVTSSRASQIHSQAVRELWSLLTVDR